MQTNINQDIRADFGINDVFKPTNANQLAKAIHYDFVVTQDMFDTFVSKHSISSDGSVDIGRVISSNLDGSDGTWGQKVKAPVSIYISANTQDYKLIFTHYLISNILDVSDFMDSQTGEATRDKTADMVNVYSAYPYVVETLPIGFNLWSTINAYVIINRFGYSDKGICKIGYYSLSVPFNVQTTQDICIVAGTALGAFKFTQSPTAEQIAEPYRPAVVFANWMCGSSVTTEYSINSTDTILYGLYHSMMVTLSTYSCDIALSEDSTYAKSIYHLSSRTGNRLVFSNASANKTITISKDGTITRGNTVSAPVGKAIIFALGFDTTNYQTERLGGVRTVYNNQMTILRSGASTFSTIPEDTQSTANWYNSNNPFKFMSETTLDIYTWFGITMLTSENPTLETVYDNGGTYQRYDVCVDFSSLTEGIVYEINVHILRLPIAEYSEGGQTVFVQQQPPSDNDRWKIHFIDNNTYKKYNRWGVVGSSGSSNFNALTFSWQHTNTQPDTSTTAFGLAFSEMACATQRFVRLGDSIYVMSY